MDLEMLVLYMLLLLGAVFLWWAFVHPANLPPRVPAVPFLGSLPWMRKGVHGALRDWHNKYGPIITVQMGSYRAIVIGKLDILKEAYGNSAMIGRPEFPQFEYITDGKKRGVGFNEGPHETELKEFFKRSLKEFGFAKRSMEGMLHEDVEDVLSRLPHNTPVSIKKSFGLPVLRSLWLIATGQRYELDDVKLSLIASSFTTAVATATGPGFLMPWFNALFPSLTNFRLFTQSIDLIKSLIREKIKEHMESGSSENADFIDAFLEQMKVKKDVTSSAFHSSIAMENLLCTVFNVFGGGLEATSASLQLGLVLLAAYPEVQEEFAQQLRREIGPTRLPELSDQARIPIVEGIISEILRMGMSFGNPHKCTEDTTLRGYKIPKGTLVFANMHYIHHDPALWINAAEFDPARYEKNPALHKQIITFSTGRRMCPGELYSRNAMFLFLAAICQRFSIAFDPDSEIPSVASRGTNSVSFHHFKENYKVIFTPRT